jgi:hypothetical protein
MKAFWDWEFARMINAVPAGFPTTMGLSTEPIYGLRFKGIILI